MECAEENQDFRGEIGEAGQADRSEGRKTEGEAQDRHWLCKTAQLRKGQGAGALADLARYGEERGDRKAVGEHQQCRAGGPDDVERGDAQEDIAHVHDARVAEHRVETLLADGGQAARR